MIDREIYGDLQEFSSFPTVVQCGQQMNLGPVMNILGRPKDFFVGRQTEQTAFRAALNDVVSGHGQLVMLVGDPGIGKTRTAQEMTSYADAVGVRVLWGRCYEGEPRLAPLR